MIASVFFSRFTWRDCGQHPLSEILQFSYELGLLVFTVMFFINDQNTVVDTHSGRSTDNETSDTTREITSHRDNGADHCSSSCACPA